MLLASIPARLPTMKSDSPAKITGRRPRRSESGATITFPEAIASIDSVTRSCAVFTVVANWTRMSGSAGRIACMAKVPSDPIAAEAKMRRRAWERSM